MQAGYDIPRGLEADMLWDLSVDDYYKSPYRGISYIPSALSGLAAAYGTNALINRLIPDKTRTK